MIVIFLALAACDDLGVNLPFDDDESGPKYGFDFDEVRETAKPKTTPKFPIPTVISIIRTREIICCLGVAVYIIWFVFGLHSINKIKAKVVATIQNRLKDYFAAVPMKLTKSDLHRMNAFSTGRICYKGVLVSVIPSRRCDPLGYLFDLIRGNKSTLIFEFLVETKQNVSVMFHVSKRKPGFTDTLQLEEFTMSDARVKCFTDLEDRRHDFASPVNGFIETHPNALKLVEISDANRFDLYRDGKNVVRIELEFTNKSMDSILCADVVDWAVLLADKYCTVYFPQEIVDKTSKQRASIFIDERASGTKAKSV